MARKLTYPETALLRFEEGTIKRFDARLCGEERAAMLRRWLMERLEQEERRAARRQARQMEKAA